MLVENHKTIGECLVMIGKSKKQPVDFQINNIELSARLTYIRGIAIIGVILIHTTAGNIQPHISDLNQVMSWRAFLALVLNQMGRFAVPVFLLLSGVGLTLSNKESAPYMGFIWSRIKKLLPAYLVWTFVYFLLGRQYNYYVFGKTLFGLSTHLYFIPLLLSLYMLYPVLRRLAKSLWGLGSVLCLLIFSEVAFFITGMPLLRQWINPCNWAFYFVLGIWIVPYLGHLQKLLRWKHVIFYMLACLLTIAEALLWSGKVGLNSAASAQKPSVVLLTIGAFYLMMNISKRFKVIDLIAKHSFLIYLSHMAFLTVIAAIFRRLGISWLFASLGTIVVLLISLLFSILCQKMKAWFRGWSGEKFA